MYHFLYQRASSRRSEPIKSAEIQYESFKLKIHSTHLSLLKKDVLTMAFAHSTMFCGAFLLAPSAPSNPRQHRQNILDW